MAMRDQFWQHYSLDELSREEWEALCDGCALCCLHKLEDEDSGAIAVTDLSCRYLDLDSCRCSDYPRRHINVPDCVPFDVQSARSFYWLPDTCAYRRLAQGRALPDWHWLLSGDKNLVHTLQVSAQNQSISETLVPEDLWQERVVRWVESDSDQKA
ncbi:YcgN family cysteine cluster protein [Agaribacterium haliotis]|uniref:YcgN family cysteine cluster protein n=1 Tax=Agaribacterium haliotis TaxID=2013869 RepID=UPI001EFCB603|nr:YcgN family cysteine cluster protein [Agaribacterium haliotis]